MLKLSNDELEPAIVLPSHVITPEANALSVRLAELGEVLTLFGPVVRSRKSQIYFSDRSGYPTPVAVKLYLGEHGVPPAEAAAAEFAALQRMHEVALGGHGLPAPRPYAHYPQLGVVISEWVPGQTLHALLARGSTGTMLRTVGAAGAWLGRLARATATERAPISPAEMLRQYEDMALGRSERRALALLRQRAAAAAVEPVTWFPNFGDFKPENLLVCEGRIYGVDAGEGLPGPAVIDAAHFLNHVVLQRPVRLLGTGGAGWDRRVTQAFRAGYESADPVGLASAPLDWARLCSALRLSASHRAWSRPPCAWMNTALTGRLMGLLSKRVAAARDGVVEQGA